ncbi:MAG: 50S ribosomal protein L29 [Candidatus Terrybacteria bacterium RIFCSPLOWO2_01_FULL_40_23]|uniref:Large ribosomal subunit protein uL29 n=1 Tax=Candidatus Terrybacteria bacterium RIFCSPLOWO2_01_FULL_40_23 TaxID=1802366 RepID=A0A1G2PUR2_9BACT|nr:MAG: 50S ribosomal protein L29 [Parcubacteria group bacterium GW2011_GWB1_40_14]OHA52050.1 MAG: 50S ribosomal protein L29 [Candidatus Terrybacteria bacterium RIFCSPLOWO2_01_FULL_40_23]
MKAQELNNKSNIELNSLLTEQQEKLKSLRVLHSAGKVKNVKELNSLRKDIARINTVLASKR